MSTEPSTQPQPDEAIAGSRIRTPEPPDKLTILGEDDRILLTVHRDGRVEGAFEDASEAGRIFVETARRLMGWAGEITADEEARDV